MRHPQRGEEKFVWLPRVVAHPGADEASLATPRTPPALIRPGDTWPLTGLQARRQQRLSFPFFLPATSSLSLVRLTTIDPTSNFPLFCQPPPLSPYYNGPRRSEVQNFFRTEMDLVHL